MVAMATMEEVMVEDEEAVVASVTMALSVAERSALPEAATRW